ncbi:gas vesicle protein [Adhaeribacter arboris]|uniref:Gas vesicle protein n=1 Tax=Adhaeribacter arboris TaxID=2072846 RepID=A0A2T2YEK2_9BACT|nr:YtxH domain-containing protein [Adhaeribacter arboris]PSR53937.1 gas vesicle protein [Adhaeribacter arboris]
MSKKVTTTLLAFLSGVATGAAFGVLYAPDKGRETRDRLSYQLDKYRDMLKDLTDLLRDNRETPQSAARSEGQRVIKDAKDKAEKLLGDVDLLISQINSRKEAL